MKLIDYLKDKTFEIIFCICNFILIIFLLFIFNVNLQLIIIIFFIFIFLLSNIILIDYFKKNKFYQELLNNLKELDKKNLLSETIKEPNFLDGKIIYNAIKELNKNHNDSIMEAKTNVEEFKEYVEMWIHEIKTPISSISLMTHNNHEKKYMEPINKLNNYIDQILYYVRSETPENDYYIKEVFLNNIINKVLLYNKDDILENKIEVKAKTQNFKIYTDPKWIEFILNQIINNSIKYKKDKSYIEISVTSTKEEIILKIKDNGIGIPSSDLNKVFNKSYTGNNGKMRIKSTGMGLYITKKLIDKLGHKIIIDSIEGEYTEIILIFGKNKYYDF